MSPGAQERSEAHSLPCSQYVPLPCLPPSQFCVPGFSPYLSGSRDLPGRTNATETLKFTGNFYSTIYL